MISLIAAMGKYNVIGNQGKMPWHLPADLQHFKKLTLNKTVIMGRKTFESIGKPLPSRTNIILTSDRSFSPPDCVLVHSFEDALRVIHPHKETMIIGGNTLYTQFMPFASRLFLTLIPHVFTGDTFFPAWNPQEWQETSRNDHQADEKNSYNYSFIVLDRIKNLASFP